MSEFDDGIWNNDFTFDGRIDSEWPPAVYHAFCYQLSARAELAPHDLFPIIQIGPSMLYGATSPEVGRILHLISPQGVLISLDTNSKVVEGLHQRYAAHQQHFIPICGNGWQFMDVISEHGVSAAWLKHNTQLILASNNLSRFIEKQIDEYTRLRFINAFLDQAYEALAVDGEIILLHNNAALCIKLVRPEWSVIPLFTIPEDGYTEMMFLADRAGRLDTTTTAIWSSWINVMRTRDDVWLPPNLVPATYLLPYDRNLLSALT